MAQHHLAKYQAAVDDLSEAIKLKESQDPPVIYAEAYKARGAAREALGKDTDAKRDFAKAYYRWGKEAYKNAQYQESIRNFNAILDLIPPSYFVFVSFVYDERGAAKAKLGGSKGVLGDLERAQQLYQEAIEDYDEAIRLNGEDAQLYRNRGETKLLRAAIRDHNDHNGMVEDYESAIDDFEEAIKGNSDFTVYIHNRSGLARCFLGYAEANQGNFKKAREQYNLALEDFKQAIKLEGDNASYYKGLGLANAALGKAKAAIDAFERAKRLEETEPGN